MLLTVSKANRMRMVLVGALTVAVIIATHVPWLTSQTAKAQADAAPIIRSIALGRGLQPNTELMIVLQQNTLGLIEQHVVEVEDTGGLRGHDLAEKMYGFNEGIVNTQPFAGTSWIATGALTVDEYHINHDSSGALQLTGPTTTGPFGDPRTDGRPTALAVLPQPRDPTGPWIVIGTDTANVILAKSGIVPCTIPVGGPVVDLAVVPQVGYFAVVALVNRRDGQHLVGIRPPNTTSDLPIVVFDLTPATATAILAFDTHGFIEPAENAGLFEPAPINLLAANGTQFIHRLTIPAEPTIGGTFQVQELKATDSPIAQAAIGRSSLAMLSVDGAGVLYDPGFRVDRGGVSGKLMTIFGSSLEVRPSRLSLQGRQRFVTAFIEVANNNAAQIDRSSIKVKIGGAELANNAIHAQLQPADSDHDGILDLEVKLDRAAVQTLIPTGATSVIIKTNWRFTDGSTGFASAEIRIKRDGDDE